ncbi:MAG: LUD domain-containing protein [Anaerolineales bacterium]|nr:LUD domain-containing protein [Anaerolineales bacterium]
MTFAEPASAEQIRRTAQALEANGMRTYVANSGDEARRIVLDLLPEEAEVFTSISKTLETLGISTEIEQSGRFNAIRPKFYELRQQNRPDEMRRLGASPDFVVGSVHAITEQGQVLIASGSGSQLGPYVFGAGRVIWVVGAQKIVRNLEEGMRRIKEYAYPLEDARARQVYGQPSRINKVLLINGEGKSERITVVLVKENLGF